ncbi:MAG: modification methylase, partial [Spirochaetota bacterium]
PNIHKYPATMLPQIGIQLLKEFSIREGHLLDPYCGSGSSFAAALECGIQHMDGFDMNPLAVLISRAKFTEVDRHALMEARGKLSDMVFSLSNATQQNYTLPLPPITNITYWFAPEVIDSLQVLRYCILQVSDEAIRNLFLLPFSELVRDCSYTRNNEFKLYRMKAGDMAEFKPEPLSYYFKKLDDVISIYTNIYLPKLARQQPQINISSQTFQPRGTCYDVVLTSPPYGDSRTTVAYGQFSCLANEWLGVSDARRLDSKLLGGVRASKLYTCGLIAPYIEQIAVYDRQRALDVSAFYSDLAASIQAVARSLKKGAWAFYIVGNRTVKKVQLPTDQFIAESFENNGFRHAITMERILGNKSMPSQNSPTNQKGKKVPTMATEYIVVLHKKS